MTAQALAPAVRGRHMKLLVECIEALDAPSRARVTRAIVGADARIVADATPLEWLPLEVNLRQATVSPSERRDVVNIVFRLT